LGFLEYGIINHLQPFYRSGDFSCISGKPRECC